MILWNVILYLTNLDEDIENVLSGRTISGDLKKVRERYTGEFA
jgi:hypothetical protein